MVLNVLKVVGGDHLGFIGHNGSQEHFSWRPHAKFVTSDTSCMHLADLAPEMHFMFFVNSGHLISYS